MKKHKFAGMVLLCGTFILAGCKHEHVWEEATCEMPKHCTECEATDGETLEHDWKDATCTQAKSCEECGTTEGEVLGHSFLAATCVKAEECEVCGETKGEPAAHTGEMIGICEVCGEPQNRDLVWALSYRTEVVANYYTTAMNGAILAVQEELQVLDTITEAMETMGEAEKLTIGEYSLESMTVGNYLDWADSLILKYFRDEPKEIYEEIKAVYEDSYALCADYPELAGLKKKTKDVIDAIPFSVPDKEKRTGAVYDYKLMELDILSEEEQLRADAIMEQWRTEMTEEMKVYLALGTEISLWMEEYNKVNALFE